MELVVFLISLGMLMAVMFVGIGVVIGGFYKRKRDTVDGVRIYHRGDYRLDRCDKFLDYGKEKLDD